MIHVPANVYRHVPARAINLQLVMPRPLILQTAHAVMYARMAALVAVKEIVKVAVVLVVEGALIAVSSLAEVIVMAPVDISVLYVEGVLDNASVPPQPGQEPLHLEPQLQPLVMQWLIVSLAAMLSVLTHAVDV